MTVSVYGPLFSGAKITPAIRRAAQKALSFGELRIRTRTPVRTGRMRAGWQLSLEGYGVRVTNDVPYTIYNEMGTRRMAARPMAAPTVPEMASVFKKELAREVGRALTGRIVGSLDTNVTSFESLTSRARPVSGGFRKTGKNAKKLNYAEYTQAAKGMPKPFNKPGKITGKAVPFKVAP